MNKFFKVSEKQYVSDYKNTFIMSNDPDIIKSIKYDYRDIKLPKRATKLSAGYDIFSPTDIVLEPGQTMKIPTGIKISLDDNKFLAILPRSGLGFKYRLQLDNTCGIIDADYILSKNEGHIFIKITNDGREGKTIKVKKGSAIVQGIIMSYCKVDNDESNDVRNGGFGSTDKND